MIDPIALTAGALARGSAAPIGLVFLAGALTSVGPCVAPRYIAVVALAQDSPRPAVTTAAFVLGLVSALIVIGGAAGIVGTLWSWSRATYLLLAGGLIIGGCVNLARARSTAHGAAACRHARPGRRYRSLGAVYLLGASSALIVSPCCTPVVAGIVAIAAASGQPALGVALLAAYAAGHVLPLVAAGSVSRFAHRLIPSAIAGQASAIVGAVLMLALGAYYGVLA